MISHPSKSTSIVDQFPDNYNTNNLFKYFTKKQQKQQKRINYTYFNKISGSKYKGISYCISQMWYIPARVEEIRLLKL